MITVVAIAAAGARLDIPYGGIACYMFLALAAAAAADCSSPLVQTAVEAVRR